MKKISFSLKYIYFILFLLFSLAICQLSENNSFMVEKNISGKAEEFGQKNSVEYRIFYNKSLVYTVKIEIDYDLPVPAFKVFENGFGVLINAFNGSLTFYNSSGAELNKNSILKEKNVKYERSIYSSVSGNKVAIAMPTNQNTILQIYTSDGQKQDEWFIKEKIVDGLSFSLNNKILALATHNRDRGRVNKYTLFINKNGNQIAKINSGFTKGTFEKNTNLFVGSTNTNCFVFDTKSMNTIFEHEISGGQILLQSRIDKNSEIIILSGNKPQLQKGKWYYENPTIKIYNLNGSLLKEKELSITNFSQYRFEKGNKNLVLVTENEKIRIE